MKANHLRTKLFAGYAVLLAAAILSIAFVYRHVAVATAPDTVQAQLHERRALVNRTLYNLYLAEGYGQLMLAGYRTYDQRYRRQIATVHSCLDSLGRFGSGMPDSLQRLRLDSIARLLAEKERSTMNLRQSIRSARTDELLDRSIRALRLADTADSLPAVAEKQPEAVLRDTVRTARSRRSFFRRLGDLFAPPHEDSSVMITSRFYVDSLRRRNVADTIAGVLRNLQAELTSRRMEAYDRAYSEGNNLRYSSYLANRQIYRLISDFEEEETAYVLRHAEQQEALRRHSAVWLGCIAIGALVLAGLFAVVLGRDIARSNRYRRELEAANRYAADLLDAREKLMLTITHDIKAPLSSVIGYIDLARRLGPEGRIALYLCHMRSAADHLVRLVNDLLDFYKLESNKMEVQPVAFSPATLFEDIASGFRPEAERKGLALNVEIDPSAYGELAADAFRIRQIAGNLLSNALKFTDRGQVTLRVRREEGRLIFSVRDTGRGIDPAERGRLFTEFVRLSSARGVEGFGLGLSIVDRLVRLLEGSMAVESTPGSGSRFIVSLPAGPPLPPVDTVGALPPSALVAPAAAEGAPRLAAPPRCLIVDDDAFQLEVTEAMCRAVGIEAESCQYPEYAPRLVRSRHYDLIITDLQMPAMNGYELVETLREATRAPVVAVSAREEDPDALRRAGFAASLGKPFRAEELAAVVTRVLGHPLRGVYERTTKPAGAGGGEPDFEAVLAYAHEDEAARRRILGTFVTQQSGQIEALRGALHEGDGSQLKALAHRMIPLFAMLGMRDVADWLAAAERHGLPHASTERRADAAIARMREAVARAEELLHKEQTMNGDDEE